MIHAKIYTGQMSSILRRWQEETGARELPTTVWLGIQNQSHIILLPLKMSLLKETLFMPNGNHGYLTLDFFGETGAVPGVASMYETHSGRMIGTLELVWEQDGCNYQGLLYQISSSPTIGFTKRLLLNLRQCLYRVMRMVRW